MNVFSSLTICPNMLSHSFAARDVQSYKASSPTTFARFRALHPPTHALPHLPNILPLTTTLHLPLSSPSLIHLPSSPIDHLHVLVVDTNEKCSQDQVTLDSNLLPSPVPVQPCKSTLPPEPTLLPLLPLDVPLPTPPSS